MVKHLRWRVLKACFSAIVSSLLASNAFGQACQSWSNLQTQSGYSGSYTYTYQVCGDLAAGGYADFNYSYQKYVQYSGAPQVSGNISVRHTSGITCGTNNSIYVIGFYTDGGPLQVTTESGTHEVIYDKLVENHADYFNSSTCSFDTSVGNGPVFASGGATINGMYYQAATSDWMNRPPLPRTLLVLNAASPAFLTLSAPATLYGTGTTTLTAVASYSNSSSTKTVTPAWTSSKPEIVSITSTGVLVASNVSDNTPVTLTASYTENGTTVTASHIITITPAGDTTPDAFQLIAQTDLAPGTVATSNAITVSGISSGTSISITGGEYAIQGGNWTSTAGSVTLGSQVQVRVAAPSVAGQTSTAQLTIGGVSGTFSATTRNFVPVTAPSQIFSNPQTATVADGVVRIATAPTTALQLASAAPQNALVALDTATAIPVASGSATLNYTRGTESTLLQVRTIDGKLALAPVSGHVTIAAPSAGSSIPVTGDTGGSASLTTATADTQVVAGPDENRNVVVAVSSGGKVSYTSVSTSRSLPTSFDVYPGEAVIADSAGAAGQIRLGSFAQDGFSTGDLIATKPTYAASTLKVPYVTGSSTRFNADWATLVGQAIATRQNLGSYQSLTQDGSTGVLTLTTSSGTYRYLPVGNLAIADSAINTTRAVSVADIAANLTQILDQSLSFAVAPATAYSDLLTALSGVSPSARLEVLGDGVVMASLDGTDFIAQPAAQVTSGASSGCPGFVTENNQLALCDSTGKRQVLNAAFADTDSLRSTFRADLSQPALSVTNNGGNGTYAAQVGSASYTLTPELTLSIPPSTQAGKLWWMDGSGKIFIRYPNGTAQGFGLR